MSAEAEAVTSLPGGGSFLILESTRPADRQHWERVWRSWPGREIQAHPAYVDLFCAEGERALAAMWVGDAGQVLYPLVLRPLRAQTWAVAAGAEACDLITPYGYGGPFVWGARDLPTLTASFWAAFDRWARSEGVVAEFARLSLFGEGLLAWPGPTEVEQPNVVRDLTLDAQAIWADYDHKVRKNVQAARRAGVRVEVDPEGCRSADFLRIYRATLKRREASANYYFPEAFFTRLEHGLAGQYCYFHALDGAAVVSSELVLVSATRVYSFLGGTESSAYGLRPNDLIKHEIVTWAKGRGLDQYVLGGGFRRDDGIFRYKRSFAPRGLLPFRVGRRVHRPDVYVRLIEARREHERALGREWTPPPDYFPEYRG